MAWVTTLGPSLEQIEYRLDADAGCSLTNGDGQVEYRLESDRLLEWVGDGLREVGIEPGTVLDEDGKRAARALADGVEPGTGKVLVKPKEAVDPRGKLPAGPLVDAIRAAAAAADTTPAKLLQKPRLVARYGRLQRGLAREEGRTEGLAAGLAGAAAGTGTEAAGVTPRARSGVVHRAPVRDLQRLADAVGVRLEDVYDGEQLAVARQFQDAKVVVGNRGYDVTLDLPKSYSVLMAMASPEVAEQLENVYLDAVRETVTAMQRWAGYGMRGHHGDGETAERVDGTGLLGWMTVHRTARPVDGHAPDPHLHAHVTLMNMVKGVDGEWSTIGAGGRDIHRHASAADALVKARLRAVTQERWGVRWARDPRTGAWEITEVPTELRTAFSKRAGQLNDVLAAAGVDVNSQTPQQLKQLAAKLREAKLRGGNGQDLRADWHAQAHAAGFDPAELVAAAMPGPDPSGAGAGVGVGPDGPRPGPDVQPTVAVTPQAIAPEEIAAHVFRPEDGLTGHRKVVTRADVLAAVMDAVPHGVTGLAEADRLTDAVLQVDVAVPLPPAGATHMSNAQRYSSTDVVDAERAVLAAARQRYAGGYAVVPADVLARAVVLFEVGAGFRLGDEQRAVLTRLATAGHGVDVVVGVAGAGKTTIMAALRAAYEATGQVVAGASTAAVAAQNLQAEAGIESRTIASWLLRIKEGDGLAGVDVLVVDEAAMVDDRHMATLLQAAGRAGTKVIGIGDPQQLKAVGVGGTFAAVHELVDGLQLRDNRRQRDQVERAALATWRAEQRRAALQSWADSGRVHVTGSAGDAHAEMLAAWADARTEWTDPHDRAERLLMLAHRNRDVDELNRLARQHRVDAGELPGTEGTYQRRDGSSITLSVGDQVLLRINDRRRQGVDVLNGFRGIILDLDPDDGRARIQWRQAGPDGPQLVDAWVTGDYISRGGVTLGYAITAAKAQGLTSDVALVYGAGMEANVLYPAMSRDRERVDLWLALDVLEDDSDRARHGTPATPGEARQRAVDAYAAALERDRPDGLVLDELGQNPVRTIGAIDPDTITQAPLQLRPPATVEQQHADVLALARDIAGLRERLSRQLHATTAGTAGTAGTAEPEETSTAETASTSLADRAARAEQTTAAAVGRVPAGANAAAADAAAFAGWRQRPNGRFTDRELAAEISAAAQAVNLNQRLADADRAAAEQAAAAAAAGDGPSMQQLLQHRDELTAAAAAAGELRHAEQAAQTAAAAAAAARREIADLRTEQRRSRLTLALQGTSRAELETRIDALRDTAVAADADHGRARTAAAQHRHTAAAHPNAAADLRDLQQRWTEYTNTARELDVSAAGAAGRRADLTSRHTANWQERADALRGEAATRAAMPPLQARVEAADRDVVRTQQRAAQQAAARREAPAHEYQQHPTIDRGPTIGL
ncbi:MobF family relaxase [Dactylosporangium sp. CA-152071]|uniref:MobF family relaxase n=1 Tax=Dactylosporangium sp. CA-152071 TaxID=3239933 RepID=UPI003D8C43BE